MEAHMKYGDLVYYGRPLERSEQDAWQVAPQISDEKIYTDLYCAWRHWGGRVRMLAEVKVSSLSFKVPLESLI